MCCPGARPWQTNDLGTLREVLYLIFKYISGPTFSKSLRPDTKNCVGQINPGEEFEDKKGTSLNFKKLKKIAQCFP